MPIVTTKQILKKLPDNFRLTSILEEAITNSIQANASKIDVYFETLPIDLTQEKRRVKNFCIIDNGDGFTDDNIDSFNHYLSDFKEKLGCKGVGRFTYLTLCDKVKFKSFNNRVNIKFNFDIDMEEIEPKRLTNEPLIKKTKIDFINVHNRDININFQDEEKEIIGHFLSIFKFMVDENKDLTIKFHIDDSLVSTIKAKEHGTGFEDDSFNIKVGQIEEEFIVSYKQKGSTIKGYYCADRRSVKQDTLGLKFRTGKDKGLLYFVSSKNSHYDLASAMIKAIRGSDIDASIYYLARLIDGGESVEFISRRLVISASEDIGNANPNAIMMATSIQAGANKIGFPEVKILLAQCVVYLASSPKSRSSYKAINKALTEIQNGKILEIPENIQDKHIGYLNPHEFGGYVKQTYLKEDLKFYQTNKIGFEKTLDEWNNKIKGKI